MSPERELPSLHFKSVEELPPETKSSHEGTDGELRESGRSYNYAVQQAEEELSSILFYAKNKEVNKKLQALDEVKERLEYLLESQFEVESKFEEVVSRNYSFFRDQNSVKNTFVNFQKVYERTGVKPLLFYSDFTFDLPDDFEDLSTVFNEPELFIFARILSDDATSKSHMRVLKEHIVNVELKLQLEEMRRTALQMTGMTQEKAEEAYNHFVKIFLTEGLSLSLDYKDWQSVNLALELRKYFDIKSAGSKEENEQVENRYRALITEFLKRIFNSVFSDRDFLYICKRFQDEYVGLSSIHSIPVPGIFEPQEVEVAYRRLSNEIRGSDRGFGKEGILSRMIELKKVVGVPPRDKAIVVRVLIDSLKDVQSNNMDESILLQKLSLAEELMETSFASDENSRKEIYDAIFTDQENAEKSERACVMFEQLTNTVRVFSGDLVRKKYKESLAGLAQTPVEYIKECFASIESITHVKSDIKKKDIQSVAAMCLAHGYDSIKKLEFLKELIGDERVCDNESVQEAYKLLLEKYVSSEKKEDFDVLFVKLSAILFYTKQNPSFKNKDSEQLVQRVYGSILKSYSELSNIIHFTETLRSFFHIEPCYAQETVDAVYERHFHGNLLDELKILKLIVKQIPSPAVAKKFYNGLFQDAATVSGFSLRNRIEKLQFITEQDPDFDQSAVDEFYYIFSRRYKMSNILQESLTFLFSAVKMRPSPEIVGKALTDNFMNSNVALALDCMPEDYPVEYHELVVANCVRQIENKIMRNPHSLSKLTLKLDGDHPLNKKVKEKLEVSPWIQALRAIEHIQSINENEANDPWRKELTPLVTSSFDKQLISLEKPEDAEYLVRFVQEVGMINDLALFKIFLACNRARNFEDLPEDIMATCENFGVRLKKSDGKWRLPGPRAVISELWVAVRQMMVDLFKDKEIPALETELGEGLFSTLRGSTQWERGDRITVLARKWRETIARDPKAGELPEGVQESKFSVKTLNTNKALDKQEEKNIEYSINKIFSHKELMVPYVSMSEALRTGITETDPAVWWKTRKTSILFSLGNAIEKLQAILIATPEELGAMIEMEEDEDKKQLLVQKRGALSTERGQRSMEKQLSDLKHAKELVSAIEYLEEQSDEETIMRAMEVLAYAGITSYSISRSLRELSALHLVKTMPDGFRNQLMNEFAVNTDPTVERVNLLANISRQFILEHYLHPEQNFEHTGHSSFSKELLKELKSVWGIKFDDKGRMPIEVLNTRVQNVVHGDDTASQKGIEVAMVPAKGILRIFGGDFGDACFTSLHGELAEGKYPGLFAWVYITNYGTPQVAIKGSLLGIVTEREDGAGALIARANNPKENFIRSVDHKQFIIKSLKEVVDSARKIHEARLHAEPNISVEKKRMCVAIPLDNSSNSCTNRPLVAEVYHKHFKSLPRAGFKNTPETNFNNYNIWNKNGSHACAVIWEIDENGKETWFGDWGDISVKQ